MGIPLILIYNHGAFDKALTSDGQDVTSMVSSFDGIPSLISVDGPTQIQGEAIPHRQNGKRMGVKFFSSNPLITKVK